jgi:hypothetical protein
MYKKLLLTLIFTVSMFASMQVGSEFENFKIKNQFDKEYSITPKTKKVIFVFSKANGHIVKDYLSKKPADFLDKKDTLFVADVSAMPSFVAWFVLPGLKDNKFSIIVLKDDDISKKYKTKENEEKITVVYLDNKKITDVKYFSSKEELENDLK